MYNELLKTSLGFFGTEILSCEVTLPYKNVKLSDFYHISIDLDTRVILVLLYLLIH